MNKDKKLRELCKDYLDILQMINSLKEIEPGLLIHSWECQRIDIHEEICNILNIDHSNCINITDNLPIQMVEEGGTDKNVNILLQMLLRERNK